MAREADHSPLIVNGPANRLPDPVSGIRAKAVALLRIKAGDSRHQADDSLLHQILERHTPTAVPLGYADHQAQVGLNHPLLGVRVPPLDPACQFHFLIGR